MGNLEILLFPPKHLFIQTFLHYLLRFYVIRFWNSLFLIWSNRCSSFLWGALCPECVTTQQLWRLFAQGEAHFPAHGVLSAGHRPRLGPSRLSLFCFIHRGKNSQATRAAFSEQRGVTFPAKFQPCYRREGSQRTFGLRINIRPLQCRSAYLQSQSRPNSSVCLC